MYRYENSLQNIVLLNDRIIYNVSGKNLECMMDKKKSVVE